MLSEDQIDEIIEDCIIEPMKRNPKGVTFTPESIEAYIAGRFGAKYAISGRRQLFETMGLYEAVRRSKAGDKKHAWEKSE